MKKIYHVKVVLVMFFCALLVSCVGKTEKSKGDIWERCNVVASWQVVNGDSLLSCDFSAARQKIQLPLSSILDTLEVVRLENREDALVGRGWPEVSENYIGIRESRSPYKLFTREGKFIGNVGNVGQGPGEYTLIYSSQIDEAHDRIYLLPWNARQVLAYDLRGQFIENIPLAYLVPKGYVQVDYEKRRVVVMNLAFEEMENISVAWLQDWEGNIIHENKSSQMLLQPDFSNEIYIHNREMDALTFSYLRSLPVPDSLYLYQADANKLTPLFTMDFGADSPLHNYLTCSGFYMTEIYGPNPDPKTTHLYTSVVVDRVIVDSRSLRGAHFCFMNDFLGGIHLEKSFLECGYTLYQDAGFGMCIEPSLLLELIEERLIEALPEKTRNFLLSFQESISTEDNNYVILGKVRNN
jgi:hypothetical protein